MGLDSGLNGMKKEYWTLIRVLSALSIFIFAYFFSFVFLRDGVPLNVSASKSMIFSSFCGLLIPVCLLSKRKEFWKNEPFLKRFIVSLFGILITYALYFFGDNLLLMILPDISESDYVLLNILSIVAGIGVGVVVYLLNPYFENHFRILLI
ncbi:hypothetical protein MsAg5_07730 [Methanosarcinaceae archaeon Ag5]|uniref:Uncharacterized protein n=1 Tax=Methanolapillus africanus TaxID=3028297 RepID=A0AAE4MIP3_9EURY|nr:hypothetical protein [Methanosarcinaceae archaeon Ag5]